MNRRLLVNLAVFGVVFLVLSAWAVTNVLHLDAIERPWTITAQFETSPGLRPGYEVTYFGVHAGLIGSVRLDGDHATVQLKIDRDIHLPVDVDAAVRRKSAVGEPYVDLLPHGGTDPGGPRLQPGAVIPVSRTTTPLSYGEVFTALDNLVRAVPPADLAGFLHSLAAGFEGRGPDIRASIVAADDLTSKLARDAPLLDQVASDLTTLTHTLTEHRDAIGASWDNLAALSQTLAAHRDDLAGLLDNGPTLLDDMHTLLQQAGPSIGCVFDSAAGLWSSIADPVKLQQFGQLVDLAGPAADIIQSTAYQGPDGLYLNGVFVFNPGLNPTTIYDPPHQLRAPPTVPPCTAPREDGAVGGTATAPSGPAPGGPAPTSPVTVPGRPGVAAGPASSTKRVGGHGLLDGLLPWLALLAALVALAALVRARRRRRGTPAPEAEQEAVP